MMSVEAPITSVYPSGADLATWLAPRFPDAPGRLSTTTGCPHISASFGPTVRARMSMPVPGENGTTIFTGCVGQDCACAARHHASSPNASAFRIERIDFLLDGQSTGGRGGLGYLRGSRPPSAAD